MGRLIDEGELIKVLEERATNEAICGYMTAYDVTNSIIDEVKEQPTAYDPDKVVEQMEDKMKELNEISKGVNMTKILERQNHGYYTAMEHAIEIVKGGGVK